MGMILALAIFGFLVLISCTAIAIKLLKEYNGNKRP